MLKLTDDMFVCSLMGCSDRTPCGVINGELYDQDRMDAALKEIAAELAASAAKVGGMPPAADQGASNGGESHQKGG